MPRPQSNQLSLGFLTCPGKATILSAARKSKWDVRSGWGMQGATTIWVGVEPCEIKVRIELWDDTDFELFQVFSKAVLEPSVKTGQFALDVKHDVINRSPLNVTAVQVVETTALQQDDNGLWSCEITLLEFKRPLPAVSQPKASIPSVVAPTPTAQDAADAQIAALSARVATLAGP